MKQRMERHAVIQPLDQSIKLIALTQNQNAIVDAEDFDRLMARNWCAVCRNGKRWRAQVIVNKVKHHIGYFDLASDAARAYDRAAIHYFGEFARTNFPRSDYEPKESQGL